MIEGMIVGTTPSVATLDDVVLWLQVIAVGVCFGVGVLIFGVVWRFFVHGPFQD